MLLVVCSLIKKISHNALMYTQRNWTPLYLAVQNHHISVIEMLTKTGVNVNAEDKVSHLITVIQLMLGNVS